MPSVQTTDISRRDFVIQFARVMSMTLRIQIKEIYQVADIKGHFKTAAPKQSEFHFGSLPYFIPFTKIPHLYSVHVNSSGSIAKTKSQINRHY